MAITSYHIIPYGGAKGNGGTPGKNLTGRVVIDLIVETKNFKPSLVFDNCVYETAQLAECIRDLNSLSARLD